MDPDLIGKILAITCAFVWAFAVILFKRSGETMSPVALNVFKSTSAGLVLFPIWYFSDPVLIPDTVTGYDLFLLAVSGILGITVADSLFFICLNKLGAGLYSIIDCVYSPSMIFLSWLILGEPLTLFQILGSALVIGGVLMATTERKKLPHLTARQIALGSLAGVSAIVIMVISIIMVKPILDAQSAVFVVEIRMIFAVLTLHLYALFHKDRKRIYKSVVSKKAFTHALPGAILGNVISMLTWVAAFKYTDMGSASVLNQTNVIFVVILAAIFLKEPLDKRRIFATILGFLGSAIVLTGCL